MGYLKISAILWAEEKKLPIFFCQNSQKMCCILCMLHNAVHNAGLGHKNRWAGDKFVQKTFLLRLLEKNNNNKNVNYFFTFPFYCELNFEVVLVRCEPAQHRVWVTFVVMMTFNIQVVLTIYNVLCNSKLCKTAKFGCNEINITLMVWNNQQWQCLNFNTLSSVLFSGGFPFIQSYTI